MFRGDHLGGGGGGDDKDRGHGGEGSASASKALSPQVKDAIELFSIPSKRTHHTFALSQVHFQVQNWQRDKPLLLSNPTLRKEIFNILKQMEDHMQGDAEKGRGKQSPAFVADTLETRPSKGIRSIRAMMNFTAEETDTFSEEKDTFSLSQRSSPSEGGGAGLAGASLVGKGDLNGQHPIAHNDLAPALEAMEDEVKELSRSKK